MKFFIILNILASLWTGFNQIHEVNKIKREAEAAFKNGNNKKAIDLYTRLINSFKLQDENLRLNLAHSCYKENELSNASYHYKRLTSSPDNMIRSVAFHQLGVISEMNGKHKLAISYFKEAIKTNPGNEKARYNYEMIKKVIDREDKENIEQKNRQEKGKGKLKENKEKGSSGLQDKQTNSEKETNEVLGKKSSQKNKTGNEENSTDNNSKEEEKKLQLDKKGDKNKELLKTRLTEINISEEKAKIILETMKNAEIQYIQQRRHNEYNEEYKNKPNW